MDDKAELLHELPRLSERAESDGVKRELGVNFLRGEPPSRIAAAKYVRPITTAAVLFLSSLVPHSRRSGFAIALCVSFHQPSFFSS